MLRRLSTFAILAAIVLFVVASYPAHSFSLFAGLLITFSTTSTLIFFAFAVTALVFGFDRAYHGQVVQAEPAHRNLDDQFVA
ncbi:hypothetical protein [Xanthobacter agilis]|jgi:hypothetical protein|uniref:Uncharacterized protein n=1 Tax=Xanthobacter agilis TaxID=47492 RepID=A0ABU0L8G0_XANAG|nr:hypothetical protein [Xanthobacter agilis]MDQ0503388.1 hypothetical protein [Xanthobacter agilis]